MSVNVTSNARTASSVTDRGCAPAWVWAEGAVSCPPPPAPGEPPQLPATLQKSHRCPSDTTGDGASGTQLELGAATTRAGSWERHDGAASAPSAVPRGRAPQRERQAGLPPADALPPTTRVAGAVCWAVLILLLCPGLGSVYAGKKISNGREERGSYCKPTRGRRELAGWRTPSLRLVGLGGFRARGDQRDCCF